ncbi:MAG: DUF262 domain-containing protein [Lachnospiraceae bacterium]
MKESVKSAEIISVTKLLNMKLGIPNYQRPYKWSKKNIEELLGDISTAIKQREEFNQDPNKDNFQYRVGTIILHWDEEKAIYHIVDGQQRITSLYLLMYFLGVQNLFVQIDLENKVTQNNIITNYSVIKDWFALKDNDTREIFLDALEKLIEVVVITVKETSEAFQLFDSQNTRGKELDPHDLLKAYHLREMNGYMFEMQRAVNKWESVDPRDIKELFGKYLFPIIKWSNRDRCIPFTADEINVFKGINRDSNYSYAIRTQKAMPSFQITQPFIAGEEFFSMVDYYLSLKEYLIGEIETNLKFKEINDIINNCRMKKSIGFEYAKILFQSVLLCYYDRFRNLDEQAVKKLFSWAFMLRVDMSNLGFSSINKYALGMGDNDYTNHYPMISIIERARVHTEIANILIRIQRETDHAKNQKWDDLYKALKKINGV